MKLEQYVNYFNHERIKKKPKGTSSIQYRTRATQAA
ncbi:IS3 family transposase [Paenibacillus chitinolyticus]